MSPFYISSCSYCSRISTLLIVWATTTVALTYITNSFKDIPSFLSLSLHLWSYLLYKHEPIAPPSAYLLTSPLIVKTRLSMYISEPTFTAKPISFSTSILVGTLTSGINWLSPFALLLLEGFVKEFRVAVGYGTGTTSSNCSLHITYLLSTICILLSTIYIPSSNQVKIYLLTLMAWDAISFLMLGYRDLMSIEYITKLPWCWTGTFLPGLLSFSLEIFCLC